MTNRKLGSWYGRNTEFAWSMISGGALAAGWIAESLVLPQARSVWIALYLLAYVFGALDLLHHQIERIQRKALQFDIDILMLVAAIGAAILGAWREGALLLFLFSLGHALQHYAMGRARHAIEALRDLAPTRALVLVESGQHTREEEIPIEQVQPGALVVAKPGTHIAVDGIVAEGRSLVNQAAVTGESIPVDKSIGDEVFAGTVNGEGTLLVRVTAAVGDRTLDRVVKLVAEARTQRAPSQEQAKRFERIFVPVVLVADVLLMVVPPLMGYWTWSESLYRAMALLVAASPCALALGTPAAVLSGIAQGARRGVLIKGGAHLEMLGTLHTIALDKTGTITTGEPSVTDVVPFEGSSAEELLALAAAVESRSQHPLAGAVVSEAKRAGVVVASASDVHAVTGRGIVGVVNGTTVEIGTARFFAERNIPVPEDLLTKTDELSSSGRSSMLLRAVHADGSSQWHGCIGLADTPRKGVENTLAELRSIGIRRLIMLTGDNERVAHAIGKTYGFDEIHAALLPEGKLKVIESLAAAGPVAMVGDGVNDAPALARASVGIAMGGAGTAAALETADVALMADDLGRLPFAVGLSQATRKVIRQNIAIALGVIALLVATTVAGLSGIGLTVVIHEGSTLVVVANALRLLAYGDRA